MRADYSDLDDLNLLGQAKWAQYAWSRLVRHHAAPPIPRAGRRRQRDSQPDRPLLHTAPNAAWSGGARSAARSDKLTIRRVTPARQPALCWRRDSVVDDGEECDPWRAGEQGGKWRQAAGVLDALEVVGADPVLDGVDPSFGVGEDLFVPSVTVSTPRLYGWGIVDAAAAVQYVGLRPPDDDR
jgi:hypothetical protein